MKGKLFRVSMLVLVAVLVLSSSVFAAGKPTAPSFTVTTWTGPEVPYPIDYPNWWTFTAAGINWTGYPRADYLGLGFEVCDASGCSFYNVTGTPVDKTMTNVSSLRSEATFNPDDTGTCTYNVGVRLTTNSMTRREKVVATSFMYPTPQTGYCVVVS